MHTWDLSYETLTGVAARSYLRELKKTDPTFWDELTSNLKENLPPEDVPQPYILRINPNKHEQPILAKILVQASPIFIKTHNRLTRTKLGLG